MRLSRGLSVLTASAALVWATGPSAADPDYLAQGEQFALVARVVTSMKSCERFGYRMGVSSPDELQDKLLNPIIAQAVREGVDVATAETLVAAAIREERERQNYLSQHGSDGTETLAELEASVVTMMDYWADRCRSLADDPFAGRFVIHTTAANEAAAKARIIETTLAQVRAAAAER
ncbi:hypothetical protein [Caulobacter sp. NIBR1757]|uniref:hypothetical protein n=1 Tax=Caulobacter sp. NIBR1757 TaxID=3016000 RepID=UPI0022F09714|nr:hypothetical protein [Caulobacter sp. NIBR1757]